MWTKSAVFKNEELLINFLLSDSLNIEDSIDYKYTLGNYLITIFQDASFNKLQNNYLGLISNNNLYKKIGELNSSIYNESKTLIE